MSNIKYLLLDLYYYYFYYYYYYVFTKARFIIAHT